MGIISRVPPDLPSVREQASSDRTDVHRGAANVSPEIADQNREMQAGNVTAPKKVAEDVKTSATDVRQEQPHPVRARRRLNTRA